jgi:hypothetical protein
VGADATVLNLSTCCTAVINGNFNEYIRGLDGAGRAFSGLPQAVRGYPKSNSRSRENNSE